MAVTYAIAVAHLGRPVIAHLRDGRRIYGYVRRVLPDGIYLEPVRAVATSYASSHEEAIVESLESKRGEEPEIEEVWWPGYAAWWWIPFLVLLALIPLFWW
ncbi:MAG: hypothetical protein IMW85_09740 [Thermicanus sp.]|nr:hypothetical protein [Thermicanus sp.]